MKRIGELTFIILLITYIALTAILLVQGILDTKAIYGCL